MPGKSRGRKPRHDDEWSVVKDIARASDQDSKALKAGNMECENYPVLIARARHYRRQLTEFFERRLFSQQGDVPKTYENSTPKERRAGTRNLSICLHLKRKVLELEVLAVTRYMQCLISGAHRDGPPQPTAKEGGSQYLDRWLRAFERD